MTNHQKETLDRLAAVEATRHSLAEELASPHAKAHTVNALRDDLRNGLKAAEVHALLNIGHHLAALASRREAYVTEVRLTSEEVAALARHTKMMGGLA